MIEIDCVRGTELADLAELYRELTGAVTDKEKLNQSFALIDSNPDYALIAARDANGKLIGSLLGIVCHDVAGDCRPFMVIENVIVKSACRGQGVGKRLMEYIEAFGRQRGCYYIMFVSAANRKLAHQFYASVGYNLNAVQGFKKYL